MSWSRAVALGHSAFPIKNSRVIGIRCANEARAKLVERNDVTKVRDLVLRELVLASDEHAQGAIVPDERCDEHRVIFILVKARLGFQ